MEDKIPADLSLTDRNGVTLQVAYKDRPDESMFFALATEGKSIVLLHLSPDQIDDLIGWMVKLDAHLNAQHI